MPRGVQKPPKAKKPPKHRLTAPDADGNFRAEPTGGSARACAEAGFVTVTHLRLDRLGPIVWASNSGTADPPAFP